MIALGMVAVLGHIFPIFANFRGGKGVATLLGMALAIQPMVAFTLLSVYFLITLLSTRFVSIKLYARGSGFYGIDPLYFQ